MNEAVLDQQDKQLVRVASQVPEIRSTGDYEKAAEHIRALRELERKITSHFAPLKQKAFEAHRALTTAEKEELAPIGQAIGVTRHRMAAWDAEQERIRAEEARRQEEAIRQQALAAAAAEAEQLDRMGRTEEADQLIQKAADAPVVVTPEAPVRTAGVSRVTSWDFTVDNEELIPRKYLLVDMKGIRRAIRESKGTIRIPGITIQETKSVKVRS